ncbi:unnamed protein product [Soboliphyme baturini]|uniref:Reverse transcriptase domain-containing protein n=1 Tax=Soboliphyme baturini TaxID=241478 RepID=A0A183J750_9BILA|nr:unnamed protein product [Soboliphyme baturini]
MGHIIFHGHESEICKTTLHERFAPECDVTGMCVNASKTKSLVLSRSSAHCSLQINGEEVEQVEKFKYLGTVFTSDGKLEEEIDRRIEVASVVLSELARFM